MGQVVDLAAYRQERQRATARAEREEKEQAEKNEREELEKMLAIVRQIVDSFGEELEKPFRLSLEEMDQYAPEFTTHQWWFDSGSDGYYDDEPSI